MRILLLFFFISFFSIFSIAQKETSNWFLHNNRILVTPTGVTTGLQVPNYQDLDPTYISTSVSDSAGNLLFASDGNKIIGKNLLLMPALVNHPLMGGAGELLAQKIPSTSKYYVFYNSANTSLQNSPWTLKYAIVDLSLNNGNGDVISYDQIIDTSLSAGFTLAQGATENEAWLITHKSATDTFFCYKITANGINNTPIVSKAGTHLNTTNYVFKTFKASHDGKVIAGIAYRDNTIIFASLYTFIEAFNFNPTSGIVSNKVRSVNINAFFWNYFYTYFSVEFSPDNRLLYAGLMTRINGLQPCGYGSGVVIQYNLCYTDSISFSRYSMTIAKDFQFCAPTVTWGKIQLGADKRIHMPYTGTIVSNVNNPNRIGSYANFLHNSYQLPITNNSYVSAPSFHHKLLEKAVKNNIVYEGGCFPAPISFRITNDTINSILWNFGDPASPNNTSTQLNPSHVFSAPGIYTVTAQLYNSQMQMFDTLSELVEIKDPTKRLLFNYPADTTFCAGNSLKINLTVVNGIFHWYQLTANGTMYNSMVSDSIVLSSPGTYYVQMRQNDCNGCIMLDSIHVNVLPTPNINLGPDRNLCAGDSLLLSVNDPPASYIWNTGETTNSIWVNQGGLYWVQAEFNNNGCPKRDSIVITTVPAVQFSLPADTTLCNSQTLLLDPGIPNASYLWQNGSTQPTFTVTQPGIYWVKVTSVNSCSHSDTINVYYSNAQSVNLGNDTTLCEGQSLTLYANIPNAQYLWNDGSTNNNITVQQTGTYWVIVNNGTCSVSDTIQVTFNSPPQLFLGNDTTLCENEILVLSSGLPNASHLWQDGSTISSHIVRQAGLYWLQVQQFGCIVSDTINISYYSVPMMDLGPDLNICTGESAVINASNGFSQYLWNTGMSTQQVIISTAGIYSVTGFTINGCVSSDTVSVILLPPPIINLDHTQTLCAGETRVLNAGNIFVSYLWNDGSTLPTKTVNSTGTYFVTVTDSNGCQASDTTIINQILFAPANFLPPDTTICTYGNLNLKSSQPYKNYLWNNNEITRNITILLPGIYWLKVVDNNNCTGIDTINVVTRECLTGLYVPSAFTPNNDGRNDVLKPILLGRIKEYRFTLYNRWGQIVFQSTEPGRGWDGKFSNTQQDNSVFVWICVYQLEGESRKTEKGTVLLIR